MRPLRAARGITVLILVSTITGGFVGAHPTLLRAADPEPDVPSSIKELAQADYHVRMKALDALARLGPKAAPAVPALVQELDKAGSYLAAIHVLGMIGPAAAPAVPALLGRLTQTLSITGPYRSEQNESTETMDTLAHIGPKAAQAVPLLRSALRHPYSNIRYFAAHALGEMGPAAQGAIPDLEALRNDQEALGLYVFPYGETVGEAATQSLEKLRGSRGSSAPGAATR